MGKAKYITKVRIEGPELDKLFRAHIHEGYIATTFGTFVDMKWIVDPRYKITFVPRYLRE